MKQIGTYLLLAVGSLQCVGYILGIPQMRALGMAWVASPLPLVFSHYKGLETFSSRFSLSFTTDDGVTVERTLDPQTYGRLGGPYNRRNVYGAVAAYGPKLTEENQKKLVSSVLKYGFCNGPLAKAADISRRVRSGELHVHNPYSSEELDSTLRTECE
jgi:hypothetical protein